MIEFINEGEPQVGWFSSVTSFFKRPNKNEDQIQKLKFVIYIKALSCEINFVFFCYFRKSQQLKLRFCRPDHVFIMYVNDLFLKQLEFLIEKCTATVSKLTSKPEILNNIDEKKYLKM